MRFGEFPLGEAGGGLLAHTHRLELAGGRRVIKKGTVLSPDHLAAFAEAGFERVWCARLEPGDVAEDEAARRLGETCEGPGLRAEAPATGRVNLFSTRRGLFDVDAARVDHVNLFDPRLTIATVPAGEVVEAGALVATVKIIPFAVPSDALVEAVARARGDGSPILRVDALAARRTALILTELPGVAESQLARAEEAQARRLADLGSPLRWRMRVPHEADALAEATRSALDAGAELILLLGASAMTDPQDVLPASIERVGGRLHQVGMPVDPGNLLVLGSVDDTPVVGVPGCARSPKRSGFDQVLERLLAGREVGAETIRRMGVGGLLSEIPSRPRPRRGEAEAAPPRLAGLVLAAGRSRRMGERNKLLAKLDGIPMVARVVDNLLSTRLDPVLVVTGHEPEAVRAALRGRPVKTVENPRFAEGLSTSLVAGVEALDEAVDGVLVALGDMPFMSPEDLARLLDAFVPDAPGIYVPVQGGQRGNPVLFSRAFFAEMTAVSGDRGARKLIDAHPEAVREVPVGAEGIHIDVDTPDALAAVAARYDLEVD